MKTSQYYKLIEDFIGDYYMFIASYYYDRKKITVLEEKHDGINNMMKFKTNGGYMSRASQTVTISTHGFEINQMDCTCSESHRGKCEHIAACFYYFPDEIFQMDDKSKSIYLTKDIFKFATKNAPKKVKQVHKQVHINIELFFEFDRNSIFLNLKIGEDKLYNLNSKLNPFLNAYLNHEHYSFGKNFEYDPDVHYFSEIDEEILNFLLMANYQNRDFYLDIRSLRSLIKILKNKRFLISGKGTVTSIKHVNPFRMLLEKDGDDYKLSIGENELEHILTKNGEFAYKDNTLYIIPPTLYGIISMMVSFNLSSLYFKEEDMKAFKDSVLPLVKSNIQISDELSNKIKIGGKPTAKIYLDFKDFLFLTYKLDYNGTEIDYFDKKSNIIRDDETESAVLEDILKYGFTLDDKRIYMDELDMAGEFLEEHLEEMAQKYEVFSSTKLKNTNFLKNNHVTSTFSIGKDNIMKYEFDLGGINPDEIVNILGEMKRKKKYYRLKSGDFINLDENEELREFGNLVDDLELSDKDIKGGFGEIPKYRAIYLDSIKKDKYHIVKTDNMFDELIGNFNAYKDAKVYISASDKKILRDYQETGVKWLYNIYKCGFGGILADEMGLGKSIQLICFIKAILKENPKAKILIVSPTSLVYNWQSEFNKFGKNIKYKVLAENKNARQEDISHIEDISVLITTYGLIRRDEELYKDIDFELVAIDEAQNIKNVHALMTKAVKRVKAKMKVALTGTPLENSVLELWSIFDFIMPGYLANMLSFQRKYNVKDVDEKNLAVLEGLEKQIKPFILRRKKKDVVKELPDKIENNVFIDLDPEQKKLYIAQLEKTNKEIDEIIKQEGFTKASFKILQLITKLRELCIDPRLLYDNYKGSSAKIDNLISMTKDIIQNGHKILLFSSYKKAIDLVNLEFTNNNISTYVIDGSVSAKKRMELANKFNEDDTNVFLITLKSGGTGLNLTSADVVIHLDLWWNPQVENQATDRAHRIGQKNTVEVVRMICKGTIEERILELQNKKRILSDKLIEGEDRDANIISKLTEEDIKGLLSMDNNEE